MRGLREFAEQQAERVQEAQREQFATLTLNTAVELTGAALKRIAGRRAPPTSRRSRSATRCASSSPRRSRSSPPPARASCARARARPYNRRAVSVFDRALVRLLPAVPRPVVARLSAPYIAGPDARRRAAHGRELNARREARDRRRARRGDHDVRSEAEAIARAYRDVLAAIDARRARLEHQRQADRRSGSSSTSGLCRDNLEAARARRARRAATSCASTWRTRATTDDDARGSTASCARPGYDNVGVVLQACAAADARRRRRARRPAAERAPLQGDLRRAAPRSRSRSSRRCRDNFVARARRAARRPGATSGSRRTTSG